MSKVSLIIITGLPGTGKSTLGRRLAEKLQLPFISKDDFKEIVFDDLGWQDREWSRKVGGASYDMLYYVAESILKAGKPLIIETNFNPANANKKILKLKDKYDFTPFQIRCHTDGEVLFNRFKSRVESGNRHPGHVDGESLEEFRPILMKGMIEALNVGGELFDLDTTDFDKVDYDELIEAIKSATGLIN